MHQKTQDIQKRYDGFLQTPCLWTGKSVFGLQQLHVDAKSYRINININDKLRLGKYIERLVSFQLSQEKNINILCENIQIQQEKRTLGELDCILKSENTIVHLEIVYKFYVYDNSVGKSEIEHWIGPNRKDSLLEKLTKLKEKQLPLLYSKACENYLKSIRISSKKITQQVYFKAQLFVPFAKKNIDLNILNADCICGFFINKDELHYFKNCKFFIPSKKDWIIIPHQNVSWINFDTFKLYSKEYHERKFSPLCWIKQHNGKILKVFLVWW